MSQPYGTPPGDYNQPAGGPQGYGGYGAPAPPPPPPPPPGYPGYPGYGAPAGAARPGTIMGAAVVSYIQAGLVLIAAFFLLAGGTMADDLGTGGGTELTLLGILNLLLAGGMIAGAVMFTTGRDRLVLLIASVANLATCIYYIIRGGSPLPLIFAVLPITALALMFVGGATQWLEARKANPARPMGY